MKFLKNNIIFLLLTGLLVALILIPGFRLKLKDLFFPVAEIENAVTVSDTDFDIDLKGINVPDANLKDLKNQKLIFLNFWGTWCPPCREEWPTIQKLYEIKKDKVVFVLIAMQDEEQKVREFLQKNNYSAPVYIAQSPISDKILPKVFPTTFLLSKDGRILLKEDASKDWNSAKVHQFIDEVSK